MDFWLHANLQFDFIFINPVGKKLITAEKKCKKTRSFAIAKHGNKIKEQRALSLHERQNLKQI